MWQLLKALYLALGAGVAVYLAAVVLESRRRLNRRIEEFREEQADNPVPPNPYLALAELYAEDARKNSEARRKRQR